MSRALIIGAGHAGTTAATTLRAEGWPGEIVLLSLEAYHPYERPPLSKGVLVSEDDSPGAAIVDAATLAAHGIELRARTHAASIDRAAKTVTLGDGQALAYDVLLLATGARPRRLPQAGDAAGDVLYLRNFEDALALRTRLRSGGRLLVVGGGFIGLEVAASARAKGCSVTIVEAAPRLLVRGVPEAIALGVAARHAAEGVHVRCGTGLATLERDGSVLRAALSDGSEVVCDAVIAGIGAVPETGLAEASGLAVDNGVAVDGSLRTSDPAIFAAGDCCSFPHPLYGGRRLRLEAWRNAQDQGAAAARAILGQPVTYDAVPWFWSDQFDWTIQVAGLPDEAAELVWRPLADGVALSFHIAGDGRVVAASAFGPNGIIGREMRLAEMLIERRAAPNRDDLASPGVKLKSLLR